MTKNEEVKLYTKNRVYIYGAIWLVYKKKIAHWADEFSTDAFGEMRSMICKWRSLKNPKIKFRIKKMPPPPSPAVVWHNK